MLSGVAQSETARVRSQRVESRAGERVAWAGNEKTPREWWHFLFFFFFFFFEKSRITRTTTRSSNRRRDKSIWFWQRLAIRPSHVRATNLNEQPCIATGWRTRPFEVATCKIHASLRPKSSTFSTSFLDQIKPYLLTRNVWRRWLRGILLDCESTYFSPARHPETDRRRSNVSMAFENARMMGHF